MIRSILAATVLLLDNHEDLSSKGRLANIRINTAEVWPPASLPLAAREAVLAGL
jgi:hypothetical protein